MNTNASNTDGSNSPRKRERSAIAFPYTDFDRCLKMAEAIHRQAGLVECSKSQLAAWIGKSPTSSVFRNSVAAAKLFGLIQKGESFDKIRITELGRQAIDSSSATAAKVTSFLKVPLFEALFEKYENYTIPATAGLEADIVSLGVPNKQKVRARQVFEASAKAAGFKEIAEDKLVMPITNQMSSSDTVQEHQETVDVPSVSSTKHDLDPLVQALLDKIPKEQQWPGQNRLRWFRTLAMVVSQVYDSGNELVELKIELEPPMPKAEGE